MFLLKKLYKNQKFVLNMAHFLTNEKSSTMDPLHIDCHTALSNTICDPNTLYPSYLSSRATWQNSSLCPKNTNSFLMEHSSIDYLNNQIQTLLQLKLTHHVMRGQPFETLEYHRECILHEISQWLQLSRENSEKNQQFQEDLITLFSKNKKPFKEIPKDISEWKRLLNSWLRSNVSENIIKDRTIYHLLSADGFSGYEPKDLKRYFSNIFTPLRYVYRLHTRAVRIMYESFDANPKIASLTGTDSCCVIFLALLHIFIPHFISLLNDSQTRMRIGTSRRKVEGYLNQHREYYKDIKNVDESMLKHLGQVYLDQFENEEWKMIGHELLTKM